VSSQMMKSPINTNHESPEWAKNAAAGLNLTCESVSRNFEVIFSSHFRIALSHMLPILPHATANLQEYKVITGEEIVTWV
jgi:hypothetical protein